eukprot:TRINITY_DN22760_c0_g1_i1.p1 TRINITY_DN22760_c0_g1~~TRINITY_DN22760_c0_g1_i1.p1  ORF type:complete len:105 (-),score=19.67 TRINITY_DN22760_c0_g1_i1:137-451(-)
MEKQQPNKKPQPPHVGFPRNSNSDAINQYYKENLNKGPAAEYLPAVVIDLVVEYTQERFYVGRLVNVQDIFSKWVVGRVVKFFGNNFEEVQIHFESWPGKMMKP